MTLFAERSLK
ncbi:hypothetical protein Zm00014a_003512 [Zea mays]|uniref:Uncharacterized protein n=2 Tax=Zea mays TaxID=4577 RepID=A0A317Y9K3_MAIZE|nr:hypothetical protein Zm00014a_022486 [Zea mays]PWZ56559.1 hypothetical protein Zm00014a_003512 [Zea mays]